MSIKPKWLLSLMSKGGNLQDSLWFPWFLRIAWVLCAWRKHFLEVTRSYKIAVTGHQYHVHRAFSVKEEACCRHRRPQYGEILL
jgi:hypothetical protein